LRGPSEQPLTKRIRGAFPRIERSDVRSLRRAVVAIPSDYGGARLALPGLLYVGARRLEHLQYLAPFSGPTLQALKW
jgi:hypothetical protein